MCAVKLDSPVLDGIQSINFFNGRLLSGEDLSQEQAATRQGRRQIGQAIGAGIVNGLQVAQLPGSSTGVKVLKGLAFNRQGDAVELKNDTELSLVVAADTAGGQAGLFAECNLLPSSGLLAGIGIYILTLSPTSGYLGRAQVSGLGESPATGADCGSKYKVEGVKFGLMPLRLDATTSLPGVSQATLNQINQLTLNTDLPSLALLRNLLSHLLFESENRLSLTTNPLGAVNATGFYDSPDPLGPLYSLAQLEDCQVPLALLYWTADGIQFVDLGSVRRRPALRSPTSFYPFSYAAGYPGLGEAIALQFQEQLTGLGGTSLFQNNLATIKAKDYFRYLPAAGLIPASVTRSLRGLKYKVFFEGVTYREPVFIEGAVVEPLLRQSFSYPPIDLTTNEMIWLYWVRQNIQTIDNSISGQTQAYLLFTTGYLPFWGDARYDLSRWDYSNYSALTLP